MSRALRSFKEDELPPASSGGDVIDRLYAELSDL